MSNHHFFGISYFWFCPKYEAHKVYTCWQLADIIGTGLEVQHPTTAHINQKDQRPCSVP